jgi:hypothetical protein
MACLTTLASAQTAPPNELRAVVSDTTVTFTWTAVSGATGYRIEAGSVSGASNLANLVLPPVATYSVSNVPPGVYYVRVRSVNAAAQSAASNEVIVSVGSRSIPSCVLPPEPPIDVRGNVNGAHVMLSWTPSPTGCPASGYIVRAGSREGTADLAQLAVQSPTLSLNAPDGVYFISIVATNAYGASAPTGGLVVPVAVPTPGGRVGFNTTTPAIAADENGNAVIIGEVVNRSLAGAVFIQVLADLRGHEGGSLGTSAAFLRGETRRLAATGVIDHSSLAPGGIGCFYIPTNVPVTSVRNAQLQLIHDSFASVPARNDVSIRDVARLSASGPARVSVSMTNTGTAQTFFNIANIYLKRADGRAVGCDFAFVDTPGASLGPQQTASVTATTHAPSTAISAIAWAHWLEAGDPLGTLAAQTLESMRSLVSAGRKREAVAAWESLQQQRRAYVRQVGR